MPWSCGDSLQRASPARVLLLQFRIRPATPVGLGGTVPRDAPHAAIPRPLATVRTGRSVRARLERPPARPDFASLPEGHGSSGPMTRGRRCRQHGGSGVSGRECPGWPSLNSRTQFRRPMSQRRGALRHAGRPERGPAPQGGGAGGRGRGPRRGDADREVRSRSGAPSASPPCDRGPSGRSGASRRSAGAFRGTSRRAPRPSRPPRR